MMGEFVEKRVTVLVAAVIRREFHLVDDVEQKVTVPVAPLEPRMAAERVGRRKIVINEIR